METVVKLREAGRSNSGKNQVHRALPADFRLTLTNTSQNAFPSDLDILLFEFQQASSKVKIIII
jgi:hypothetical protein